MQNANRFLIINFLNKFFMKTINYIGIFLLVVLLFHVQIAIKSLHQLKIL